MTRKNAGLSGLALALATTFDPIIALANQVANYNEETNATGLPPPIERDTNLRYSISNICQSWYRQLYGTINSATGTKIDNIAERVSSVENQMVGLRDRYAGDYDGLESDPNYARLVTSYELATTKFNVYSEHFHAWTDVYKHIFNEDWKPLAEATGVKVVKAEDKAKYRDVFASLKSTTKPIAAVAAPPAQ